MIKSIAFPNMFTRTSTNFVTDKEATFQNLKYLILSEKGELFGDPFYGVGLKKYLFDQNDTIIKDLVLDDMYTAIATFMPQLRINRNDFFYNYSIYISNSFINKYSCLDNYNW